MVFPLRPPLRLRSPVPRTGRCLSLVPGEKPTCPPSMVFVGSSLPGGRPARPSAQPGAGRQPTLLRALEGQRPASDKALNAWGAAGREPVGVWAGRGPRVLGAQNAPSALLRRHLGRPRAFLPVGLAAEPREGLGSAFHSLAEPCGAQPGASPCAWDGRLQLDGRSDVASIRILSERSSPGPTRPRSRSSSPAHRQETALGPSCSRGQVLLTERAAQWFGVRVLQDRAGTRRRARAGRMLQGRGLATGARG